MCVFKRRLKVSVQSVILRDSGREYPMNGPATQNALSPNLVRISVPRSRWCRWSVGGEELGHGYLVGAPNRCPRLGPA